MYLNSRICFYIYIPCQLCLSLIFHPSCFLYAFLLLMFSICCHFCTPISFPSIPIMPCCLFSSYLICLLSSPSLPSFPDAPRPFPSHTLLDPCFPSHTPSRPLLPLTLPFTTFSILHTHTSTSPDPPLCNLPSPSLPIRGFFLGTTRFIRSGKRVPSVIFNDLFHPRPHTLSFFWTPTKATLYFPSSFHSRPILPSLPLASNHLSPYDPLILPSPTSPRPLNDVSAKAGLIPA